jgi:hypothetical protein
MSNLTLLYADPGAGALIWQLLLGAFIGAMFYFRRIRDWVRLKVGKGSPSLPPAAQDDKSKTTP